MAIRSTLAPLPRRTIDIKKMGPGGTSADQQSKSQEIDQNSNVVGSLTKNAYFLPAPLPGSPQTDNITDLPPRLQQIDQRGAFHDTSTPLHISKTASENVITNGRIISEVKKKVGFWPELTTSKGFDIRSQPSQGETILSPQAKINFKTTYLPPTQEFTTGKPSNSDWRKYGSFQVDWAKLHFLDGKGIVAPTVDKNGSQLYLAVNCSMQILNSTGPNLQWGSWYAPQRDFEKLLIKDICKTL